MCSYPFYADDALEWFDTTALGISSDEDEIRGVLQRAAKRLNDKDLFLIKRLIAYAEHCHEARIAGVLKGMTTKAQKAWIEQKAT